MTIILFLIAGFSILSFFVYKLWKEVISYKSILQQLITSINKVHSRVDKIFTVDAPEPNDATKADTNEIDLSESDSFQIPRDVKLDIEGGDMSVPPGFEEKK